MVADRCRDCDRSTRAGAVESRHPARLRLSPRPVACPQLEHGAQNQVSILDREVPRPWSALESSLPDFFTKPWTNSIAYLLLADMRSATNLVKVGSCT